MFVSVPFAARGVGAVGALSGLPAPVVALFAAVTVLGNPLVLFVALSLLYWRPPPVAAEPRRAIAAVVALGLAAAALTFALKGLFALPRPPGSPESGYGFPSGHALGSTVVYGGAALLFDRFDRRYAVAAAVVVLVALSRLVLGVHYLVDVVAGVAVGAAVLAAVVAFDLRRPARAFGVAAALGGLALAFAASPEQAVDAAAVAGGTVGGGLAWLTGGDETGPVPFPAVAAALVVGMSLWALPARLGAPLPVVAVTSGVAVALVVGLPRLVVHVRGAKEGAGSAG
ncbi:MAG: phosphatase PAP2 family protein [Haloferacaceae archaeon]